MKKILCAVLVAANCALLHATTIAGIIPAPVKSEAREGVFKLTPETCIASDAASKDTAAFLAERLCRATGYPLKTTVPRASKKIFHGPVIFLTTENAETNLGPEGYELTVAPSFVVIHATAQAGL